METRLTSGRLPAVCLEWLSSSRLKFLEDMVGGRPMRYFSAHLPVMATWRQDGDEKFPVNMTVKGIGLIQGRARHHRAHADGRGQRRGRARADFQSGAQCARSRAARSDDRDALQGLPGIVEASARVGGIRRPSIYVIIRLRRPRGRRGHFGASRASAKVQKQTHLFLENKGVFSFGTQCESPGQAMAGVLETILNGR